MKRMNKVLAGHQYVANFIEAPVEIGTIYKMDDEQFIPAIHFNDAFPDIDLARWTKSGSPGVIKFSQSSDVTIKFGLSATTSAGASEVKLTFRRAKSVAGAIADARVESLRYLNILPQLKQLWTQHGFEKYRDEYVFVFEVVTAASGTIIYSHDRNNEVVLAHKLGAGVSKVVDLASGQFDYVSNTKRTLEIIRPTAHKPLFKAFWFRKDFEPEILG
jgi:hypothetical protein